MRQIHAVARLYDTSKHWINLETTYTPPNLPISTYKVRKRITSDVEVVVWWPHKVSLELMDARSEEFSLRIKAQI